MSKTLEQSEPFSQASRPHRHDGLSIGLVCGERIVCIDDRLREMLVLRLLDLNKRQIARHLNVKPSEVRRRLKVLRDQLAAAMGSDSVES